MDEVLGAGADGGLRGPLQVDLEDALVRLAVALRLEGRAAQQELVAQHAQAPHVHRRVVVPALHHLRGQVVQRPAQRLPARTAGQRSGEGIRPSPGRGGLKSRTASSCAHSRAALRRRQPRAERRKSSVPHSVFLRAQQGSAQAKACARRAAVLHGNPGGTSRALVAAEGVHAQLGPVS